MAAIPRYRPHAGPILLSAGFRPFFLGSAVWAAIGIPLWLAVYGGGTSLPSLLPPLIWHVHEMVFGFAAATVAGFLLTAIPNWTGRMPLQGRPLAVLVLLWAVGRVGILLSGLIGGYAAAVADLAFPAAFLGAVAREIVVGKNWRNLPMLIALSFLLIGNLLVHLDAIGIASTAELGNRLGVATLLMLISLVGGRIIPSFTRNWLIKNRPEVSPPRPESQVDHAVLGVTALVLVSWVVAPDAVVTAWGTIIAGSAIGLRMSRWQGHKTMREPLILILHVGYGWLAAGLLLLGLNELFDLLPTTAALHALTVGAIGTMTLAVMTRASLGHTGRPLIAGLGTQVIYALVTLAALLRVLSPFAGAQMMLILWAAGASWAAAFGLFAILYGRVLTQPRATGHAARPI
jgi:uncharacterized protein involved in response to NO